MCFEECVKSALILLMIGRRLFWTFPLEFQTSAPIFFFFLAETGLCVLWSIIIRWQSAQGNNSDNPLTMCHLLCVLFTYIFFLWWNYFILILMMGYVHQMALHWRDYWDYYASPCVNLGKGFSSRTCMHIHGDGKPYSFPFFAFGLAN